MDLKSKIESRINRVTNYPGGMNIAVAIANATTRERIGSEPDWLVARACMTPAEYIAFGNDGKPWRFLDGKPDMAQRCIDSVRGFVTDECSKMRLRCDWSVIAAAQTPKAA